MIQYLVELARSINNGRVSPVDRQTAALRNRVNKFLFNALAFNINYKDTGHTNVAHMTTFPMYPLETDREVVEKENEWLYPVLRTLFHNTLLINHGYVKHCYERLAAPFALQDSPFLTRRDFNLAVFYLVLTGHLRLSETLCKSYQYSSPSNPVNLLFGLFTALGGGASRKRITSGEGEDPPALPDEHAFGVAVVHLNAPEEARLWGVREWNKIAANAHLARPNSIEKRRVRRGSTGLMRLVKGGFLIFEDEEGLRLVGLLIINASPSRSVAIFWCARTGRTASFSSTQSFLSAVRTDVGRVEQLCPAATFPPTTRMRQGTSTAAKRSCPPRTA